MILVTPETVVRWHRTGFRLYWTWLSRRRMPFGRKPIGMEVRELIFRMVAENPTWARRWLTFRLRVVLQRLCRRNSRQSHDIY
jgi:hypothetical protein